MGLISEDYRSLNRRLHEDRADYGTTARHYAEQVKHLAEAMGAVSILDYGCGKGCLKAALPDEPIHEYDPAIPGKDHEPSPAHLLVSIDVLEHVEPACLDQVLDHMQRLAYRGVFLTVATRPAKKTLADGRNAHLIVESIDWWLPKLTARWLPRLLHASSHEFMLFGVNKAAS